MDIAHLGLHQPRRLVGSNSGAHQAGLVAADQVVGQGRAAGVGLNDLAVWDKAELDQRLEAVADAAHQAVAVFEQLHHRFGDLRVAEEGDDELGGTFRLVAAGEAAGDGDDLGLFNHSLDQLDRLPDLVGVLVADDHDVRLGARALKGTSGVVLAVGAREYRNQNARLRNLGCSVGVFARFIVVGWNNDLRCLGDARINRLQRRFPSLLDVV